MWLGEEVTAAGHGATHGGDDARSSKDTLGVLTLRDADALEDSLPKVRSRMCLAVLTTPGGELQEQAGKAEPHRFAAAFCTAFGLRPELMRLRHQNLSLMVVAILCPLFTVLPMNLVVYGHASDFKPRAVFACSIIEPLFVFAFMLRGAVLTPQAMMRDAAEVTLVVLAVSACSVIFVAPLALEPWFPDDIPTDNKLLYGAIIGLLGIPQMFSISLMFVAADDPQIATGRFYWIMERVFHGVDGFTDIGMLSAMWVSMQRSNFSPTSIAILCACALCTVVDFAITLLSFFLPVFEGQRGVYVLSACLVTEIGIGISTLSSILLERASGRFSIHGAYYLQTWYLLFSMCLTALCTVFTIVGVRGLQERLARMAAVISARIRGLRSARSCGAVVPIV